MAPSEQTLLVGRSLIRIAADIEIYRSNLNQAKALRNAFWPEDLASIVADCAKSLSDAGDRLLVKAIGYGAVLPATLDEVEEISSVKRTEPSTQPTEMTLQVDQDQRQIAEDVRTLFQVLASLLSSEDRQDLQSVLDHATRCSAALRDLDQGA
ncbi:MAG: hypothetical protein AAFR68_20040 [Pseudomonadota bacterium]